MQSRSTSSADATAAAAGDASTPTRPQPLAGLRVLDLSQVMAGPFCAMLLGDMGADVVKVETPGVGDQTRRAMGFRMKGDDSAGFFALNRNKRSLALDLKNPAGLEAFHRLVRDADVLIENSRPGVAARLGIDYPRLRELNPRLVYASISGFGQTGPWSRRPGLDLIAQAMSGVMSVMGHPGQPPVKSAIPLADLGAGLFAAYGILSAVIGRGADGAGRYVDASLFETALGLSVWESAEYFGRGDIPVPIGSANRMSAPYQAVMAADRPFVVGAANQKLWTAFCGVLQRPDLMTDERFASNAGRIRHREALVAAVETTLATHPADHWVDALLAAGVPAGPIHDYAEALASEQAEAREMVLTMNHPVEGPIRTLGFPVKVSDAAQRVRHVAPLLGQHNDQILAEAGWSATEIEGLRRAGAFGPD